MKTLILLSTLIFLVGCKTQETDNDMTSQNELRAGAVIAKQDEEGKYTITKILVLDDSAVHVRFYNETFTEVPSKLSTKDLTYMIGHAPLSRAGFEKEERHLITVEDVSESELEGYRIYLEAMQGR